MSIFKSKIHTLRRAWAYTLIKVMGIKIEEIGKLDTQANIIAMNHNSALDVILYEYLHPKDIAWVANTKLAKIPIFGIIFVIPKLIMIDPTKKASLKSLLTKTKNEIDKDRPIAIFPEGTRGDTNDISKFHMGTKLLVERLNLTIQPILLINTRKRLDTKTFTLSPGTVKIIYLDTINPSNIKENWYEELHYDIKKRYELEISV